MKKTFTILIAALAAILMMAQPKMVMGQTTTLLSEDFSAITSGNSTSTSGSSTAWNGNDNFTVSTAYQAGGAVRLGSGSKSGSITSKSLTVAAGTLTVSFDVKGWSSVEGDIKVTVGSQNQTINYTAVMSGSFESKTANFTISDAGSLTVKLETTAKRAFLDNVVITNTASSTPTVATPTITPNGGSFLGSQEISITCDTDGAAIHYTTDGTTPTASSTTYTNSFTINATTTIKAIGIKNGYNNSDVATAVFTKQTPMTVAEARAAIDAGTGTTGVYAIGIVSAIPYAYTPNNGITFNMVDNEGDANFLQAYKCTGTEAPNVLVGDIAIVYGNLTKYNGTYEFGQGCTIVSLTHTTNIAADDVTIADDATSGEIEYTINNPVQGGTMSASTTSDWLTLGNNFDSPIGFTCSANIASTARTATITLTYTYGNESKTKNVIVTQNGNSYVNISTINTVGDSYSVRGTVVAINSRGFVMGDGTGYVYYYKNAAPTQAVGDMVTMSGTTGTYGQIIQFTNSAAVAEASSSNYNGTPAATVITTVPDYTTGYHLSTYLQFDGSLTKSSNTYTVNVGGTDIQISYPTEAQGTTLTALDGKTVRVKGYFTGINSNSKFTVMLESVEEVVVPVINADDITLDYDATSGEIEYTIENPVPGTSLNATLESGIDWISNIVVGNGSVTFDCDENNGSTDRTATITLAYTGATSKDVTVTQRHFVIDYAVLPFEWEGGASADLLALDGVTANSLGSDYAASNAPYLVKFDGTGDYIQVKCDQQPGKVTIGVKMIGGANTSTITVQGSADGETFTDIEALTISGAQNTILTLETTNAFAATDRYVRMLFTKGSNVGVGPITIAQVTNDPVIVADNSVELEYNETSGSISYSITNPTSATLTASTDADWISNITVGESTVTFSATTNEGSADRTATITLSYTGATDKTVTVTQGHYVAPFTPTTYTLATSIVSGKTYIITNGSNKAMGVQNSNNRAAVSVTIDGSTTTVETDDVYEFVISTDAEDSSLFNIYDAVNDGYLYAAGGTSSNYLRTKSDIDATGQWNISIDSEGVASIVANFDGSKADPRNTMKYNSNNDIFSCYASGQNDIYLYEKDEVPTTATYYYSVNGTLSEAYTCAIGSTKTLETGTDLYSNFTFAGWTTAAHDVSSPISSYTFADQGPVTFYAVYAHNSNYYTRVFNETATSDIIIYGPAIIPSFATLDMGVYNLDYYMAPLVYIPYILIEEGGQMIYHDDIIKMVIQKNINAPTGTWGEDDNTGWYTFSSPNGYWSKLSEYDDFTLPAVGGVRQYDLYAYAENFGWYNKKDGSYINCIDEGVGYLYARAQSIMFNLSGESYNDDVDLTNLSYTSRMGALAGLHCIGNPYTHNIYKGVGITGDMAANYYALNEATGAWISTTDATPITPMHAILVFVNKTDGTAAIHMTSDNSAPSSKANNDYIKFTVANNQYEDVAYAWFDKGEGLKKINHRNSEVPMVYIPQGDVNYSIATMADNTKAFNLNFKAMTTGKYTLSYKTQGEFNYMHIYDRLTGEDVDMLLEGEYSFIGSPNDNDARFIVRLGYAPDYDSEDSFVYQNGNDIIVNGEGELQIFDVTGRMVKNTVINGIETITMPQGVYIFRLNENIQKIVVR